MNKSQKLGVLAALMSLGVVSYLIASGNRPAGEGSTSSAPSNVETGYPAPSFTLPNLSGTKVSLSNYNGRVVMLDFWATWCPPCRMSIPKLQEFYGKYEKKGFTVVGISLDENKNAVPKFVQDRGIKYDVLLGGDSNVTETYKVWSLPTFYLLDRNLKVYKKWFGYYPGLEQEWQKSIEKLLSS